MHFKRLLLSLLLIQVCMGKEEIQHNLPEGVELVDPKSLGLNSDIDLDKLLGNVKLLPIGGNDLSKQTGLKTQILTVGFDGDENINLDDFELPPLPDSKSSEKPIAEAAFKSFKDFFKNPNKSVSFEEGTKTQLTKEIQEYGTKTGKILSSPKSNFEYIQSSNAPTTTSGHTKVESQSQNHNSQQRPSGTLRRRIKKPKTTTTTVPPQQRQTAQPSQSSKTTVAIESPSANSFNQFDLPNYGLPAGQSPKVIELGQEQIEKLLAQGKLTKSSGPGPQVIELGEEQLEDLLRQHSQDIVKTNAPSQNQNKVQHSPSVTTTTAATTAKPQTYLSSSRPNTESPRIQEVIKQGQIYQPPQANVIHQSNYQENTKVINLQTNNGQFTSNSNRAVQNNGYRQGNTVGNQLVPVYQFPGSNNNQQSQPQIVTNNPHLQHGFQPILQPSNLISPQQNQNANNAHFQQQFQQPQQQQHQQQQHQQQQHQQQQHQQQQQQQQQQPQQQYQQQQQHQQQQHQQQQNTQTNHNTFEVISAPPVSFSTSSEPINKGNAGNININAQQEHQRILQQQQQHNNNVQLQQQQQAFHNQQHNVNINQFRNVVQNTQAQASQQAPQSNFNGNRPNPNENAKNNVRPTQNTVQQKPQQQQQQQLNVQSQQNNNNHVMNIVRPPIQTQRIITPSPYVLHQVLNQIPTSFNPTLNVKHIVNSPILDPSSAFRQDPLPHQQQLFAPQNHNRQPQPTGQIHFPGGQNPRPRHPQPPHHRDQLVATSNHPDAYRFGQNFNIQLGSVRQSQVIGQFSHPFHAHRNLAGI